MKIKHNLSSGTALVYEVHGINTWWFDPRSREYYSRIAAPIFTSSSALTIPVWAEPLVHKAIDKANRFFDSKL